MHLKLSIVVGGLFLLGCTAERPPLPTQGPRTDVLGVAACPILTDIDGMLVQLFPAGGLLGQSLLDQARRQFAEIQLRLAIGDLSGAQRGTLGFANFTIKAYRAAQLLDPNGPAPPTTQEGVVHLIDAVFCFVSLPPTGLSPDALGPTGKSGASEVIGLLGGDLVTGERLAGLRVPANAVSDPHLFLITRRDDLALQGTCLSTALHQYPLCYEFFVLPETRFAAPVTVVVCQLEPPPGEPIHSRLVLAHPDPSDPAAIEFTTRAADPFGLVCTDAVLLPGAIGGVLRRVGAFAARLILPSPLYASHGGMGGSIGAFGGGGSFVAVDSAPDLVVDSVSHSPGQPTSLDSITVTAWVRNGTPVAAGAFDVAFAIGGGPSPAVALGGLSGNASAPVSVTIGPRAAGTYQDTVTVDATNAVVEVNETNNSLTSPAYTVRQAGLFTPP
jgi:hypothetical protein